jgi:hypothetical protein
MSGSRAKRTAAMMEAAITMVEAKRLAFVGLALLLQSPSSSHPSAHHPAMLPTMKLVRQCAPENFRWQVAPPRSTQWTSSNNPTVWHRSDWGRDGLAASLATNGEVAEPGLGLVPHRNSMGEYKAKLIHRCGHSHLLLRCAKEYLNLARI